MGILVMGDLNVGQFVVFVFCIVCVFGYSSVGCIGWLVVLISMMLCIWFEKLIVVICVCLLVGSCVVVCISVCYQVLGVIFVQFGCGDDNV